MSKRTQATAPWAENVAKFGNKGELLWRLATGEGFTPENVTEYFGVCMSTAKKWLQRLVDEDYAYVDQGTSHYRGYADKCLPLCDMMGWPPNVYGQKPVQRSQF